MSKFGFETAPGIETNEPQPDLKGLADNRNQFEKIEDSFMANEAVNEIARIIHDPNPLEKTRFLKRYGADVILQAIKTFRKETGEKFADTVGLESSDRLMKKELDLLDAYEQEVLGH